MEMEKLHWYCLTFFGGDIFDTDNEYYTNSFLGLIENKVTKKQIYNASQIDHKNGHSKLVGCSYLGHMTAKEFEGE